jgi:hypothetical protein
MVSVFSAKPVGGGVRIVRSVSYNAGREGRIAVIPSVQFLESYLLEERSALCEQVRVTG